jgi:hypothetical protein
MILVIPLQEPKAIGDRIGPLWELSRPVDLNERGVDERG